MELKVPVKVRAVLADIARTRPRRLVQMVNAAMAAALALAVLLLLRDGVSLAFFSPPDEGQGPAEKARVQPERAARPQLMAYAPILKNNVFGFPAGELTPIAAGRKDGPAAVGIPASNIKLKGVVAWPGGFGYAFLEGVSEGQEVYKTGDAVGGAGKLARVEANRIFVESGGRMVEVPLEEVKSAVQAEGSRPEATRPGEVQPQQAGPGNGFARRTSENEFVLDQKAIDESLQNPKNIMTDARLLPNMVEGVQQGFVVRELRPGGVYQNLGLQNGDVLLSVNKFKLSSPETALQAFTALQGMDRIELDVLRGGRKMTLTYVIR